MLNWLKQKGFGQYGYTIPGLTINGEAADYPVLNERAVRAGAGIMFLLAFIGFMNAWLVGNYEPLKIIVVLFFVDFFIKVIVGIKFSPISQLASLIVSNQKPEYVGAIQKRFAWSIGLLLSGAMVLLLHVFNITGALNLAICLICLTVMWMETAFAICVGCKMYYGLIKIGVFKEPIQRPACPGGVCAINKN